MPTAVAKYWPTMYDYQEAVQSPSFCFSDPALRDGTAALNSLGLPRPVCGMFASVYELKHDGNRWAAKCFLRNIPDLHDRYRKISGHLGKCGLPYFVGFDHLAKGIRVQGKWFPLVKMEWVEGRPLNEFIENNLSNPQALVELERRWTELLDEVRAAKIGHGDLQHGNVLVTDDGSLRLIDYDGMWVPPLKGQPSHETGHPDYQSPNRTEKDFNVDIDEFAGNVITIAIRAVSKQPELWRKYNNGDNLLFRRSDYAEPSASKLIPEIHGLKDDDLRRRLEELVHACGWKMKRGSAQRRAKAKAGKNQTPKAAQPASGGSRGSSAKTKSKRQLKRAAARKAKQSGKRSSKKAQPAGTPAPAKKNKNKNPGKPPSKAAAATSWVQDHVMGGGKAKAVSTPRAAKQKASAAPKPARTPKPKASAAPKPARAPKPASRRRTDYTRILIHLLVMASLAVASSVPFRAALLRGFSFSRALFLSAGGVALVAGLVSFTTLFVLRKFHWKTSRHFFGLAAAIALGKIAFEAPTGLTRDDVPWLSVMALLLISSTVGIIVETLRSRRSGGNG
ncbi:MAG: hypothetical protein ACYTEZ_06430 [Planctomycetota bacterium]